MTQHARPPWDPDPRTVEPVEPGPTRRTGMLAGCLGMVTVLLVGLATMAVIALSILAIRAPAPRSAAEPGSQPDRPPSGAPSTQAVSPDSALPAVGPTSGGTPPSPAAAQQPTSLDASAPAFLASPLEAVRGWATWYADPRHDVSAMYAAAGPAVRRMLGPHWRGRYVTVSRGDRSITVRLSDWCACGPRHGQPTVIDLSPAAFAQLAAPSLGVIRVSVGTVGLPPTDAAP